MGTADVCQLIVTVVAKERTEEVLNAIEKEGVAKSTVWFGRRISDDNPTFLELKIEPQREIIYTLAPQGKVDRIFEAIMEAGELVKPSNGFVFVLDVAKAGGADKY
ncbi:MAG: P-II family nitrogen regulator [Bacillota bacterium]|jgi:nitrogen regulatory protein PII